MFKIEVDLANITQENLIKMISFLNTFIEEDKNIVESSKKKQKFKPAIASNVGTVIPVPIPSPPPKELTFEKIIERAMTMVKEKKLELAELNRILNNNGIKAISDLNNHLDKLPIINEVLNGY